MDISGLLCLSLASSTSLRVPDPLVEEARIWVVGVLLTDECCVVDWLGFSFCISVNQQVFKRKTCILLYAIKL